MSKSILNSAKPSANSDAAVPSDMNKQILWKIPNYSTKLSISCVASFKLTTEDVIKFRLSLFKSAFCSDTFIIVQVIQDATFGKYSSVAYRISLIDAKEKQYFPQGDSATHGSPNGIFTFSSDPINKPNSGLLIDDTLKVYCEVVRVVNKDNKSSYDEFNEIMSSLDSTSKVAEEIGSLLGNAKFADVVLVVGKGRAKKEFNAHKNILTARSAVFGAMFEPGNTKEAKESRVVITDVAVDVFEQFIRFLYTGKVSQMDKYAQSLLILADNYKMDYLKKLCSQYLSSKLTTKSVSSILLTSDLYNAAELKSNCVDYIADHAEEVMATEKVKVLKAKPELFIELFQKQSVKRFKKE